VTLPAPEGRENAWHTSARAAAERAEKDWVRMVANMGAGAYDVYIAPLGIPDPDWPEQTLRDLLKIAFGNGRLIDTLDHPVIQRLLGR
jgi:hypothetical protein